MAVGRRRRLSDPPVPVALVLQVGHLSIDFVEDGRLVVAAGTGIRRQRRVDDFAGQEVEQPIQVNLEIGNQWSLVKICLLQRHYYLSREVCSFTALRSVPVSNCPNCEIQL